MLMRNIVIGVFVAGTLFIGGLFIFLSYEKQQKNDNTDDTSGVLSGDYNYIGATESSGKASIEVEYAFIGRLVGKYQNFPENLELRLLNTEDNSRYDPYDGPLNVYPGLDVALGFSINFQCAPAGEYVIQAVDHDTGSLFLETDPFRLPGTDKMTLCSRDIGLLLSPPKTPECSVKVDKGTYTYGDVITYSWSSENADYVAFDPQETDFRLKVSSGPLSSSGTKTVRPQYPEAIGDMPVVLFAYSKNGVSYCRTMVSVPYSAEHDANLPVNQQSPATQVPRNTVTPLPANAAPSASLSVDRLEFPYIYATYKNLPVDSYIVLIQVSTGQQYTQNFAVGIPNGGSDSVRVEINEGAPTDTYVLKAVHGGNWSTQTAPFEIVND